MFNQNKSTMKKRMLLLIGFLVLMIAPVLSQIEVIPDWSYLYENFGVLILTYLGIAAIASFIGEALIRLLKVTKKVLKVTLVMILAVGLALLATVINKGFLAEAPIWQAALWGLLATAAANGLQSGNLLFFKSIIEFFIGWILSKESKE